MAEEVWASGAVEGPIDESVLRRLATQVALGITAVYGKNGKDQLRKHIKAYNRAALFSNWIVLVDLDHEAECAPPMRADWVLRPAPLLCFRIAVRQIEAWLLADRERMARYLRVPVSQIPTDPESLANAKDAMVALARRSRRSDIREDMVPRPGSGRPSGPAYSSRLIEYTREHWRPDIAAHTSDSLRRCLARLQEIVAGTT